MVTSVSLVSSGSKKDKFSLLEMSSSSGNGDVGDSMKDPGMGLLGELGNGVSVASVEDDASDGAK